MLGSPRRFEELMLQYARRFTHAWHMLKRPARTEAQYERRLREKRHQHEMLMGYVEALSEYSLTDAKMEELLHLDETMTRSAGQLSLELLEAIRVRARPWYDAFVRHAQERSLQLLCDDPQACVLAVPVLRFCAYQVYEVFDPSVSADQLRTELIQDVVAEATYDYDADHLCDE